MAWAMNCGKRCGQICALVIVLATGFLSLHISGSFFNRNIPWSTWRPTSAGRGSVRRSGQSRMVEKEQLWREATANLSELQGRTSPAQSKEMLARKPWCTFGQLKVPPELRSCYIKDDKKGALVNGSYSVAMQFVAQVGMGNLMWQYSVLWAASRKYRMTPVIWEGERIFKQDFNLTMKPNKDRKKGKFWPKIGYPFPEGRRATNALLHGYNQAYTKIKEYAEEIKQEFTFFDNTRNETDTLLREALATHADPTLPRRFKNSVKIGVHVRRGDFLKPQMVRHGFTVASSSYLRKAVSFFQGKYNHTIFIVFTNDRRWTTEALRNTSAELVHFGGRRSHDLYMASTCDHMIITVGTFGWWAGFLAGGTTLYYKNFPRKGSRYASMFNAKSYYPPGWLGLGD